MGDHREGETGYVLRWLHDSRIDSFRFSGSALHPVAAGADGSVRFELVAHRTSVEMRFDPLAGKAVPDPSPAGPGTTPPVSPDGKWAVFTRASAAGEQIWIEDRATGRTEELAGGNCNNSSPAWELDSTAIVFSSGCGRAFGLPALYRAEVAAAVSRGSAISR
jgi:hypothetical protein